MNMMKIARRLPVLLVMLGIVAVAAVPAQAATGYEVSSTSVKLEPAVTSDQFVKLAEDLVVSWTAPSGAAPLMGYCLKFNTSSTPLSNTNLNDTARDFFVDASVQFKTVSKSFFDAYDSNQLRYLHIKTQYVPNSYSDDVVIGPIRIDNVAPTGSISLNPTSGSSTQITITLSASTDTKYYWLSKSSTMPADELKQDYTVSNQATGSFFPAYPDTAYGKVTIYAWFKDLAGNVSTAPTAQADYTYSAPVSIQYNASSVGVNATLDFTVDSSTHYNWEITPSATGVAYVQGTTSLTLSDAATLTVVGKAVGTFTVKATPTAGGSALPVTGTINVVQTDKTYNIPLSVGWNLISIPYQPASTAIATLLSGIAGKYSIVWGEFNPATSAWKNYNPAKQTNSLNTLEPNKGYWINATEVCTLSITGSAVSTKGASLAAGWNLIGFSGDVDTAITTILSGIAGKYSIVWGEFNPATSAWKNYNPAKQTNSLNNMVAGKGYWINATEACSLSY